MMLVSPQMPPQPPCTMGGGGGKSVASRASVTGLIGFGAYAGSDGSAAEWMCLNAVTHTPPRSTSSELISAPGDEPRVTAPRQFNLAVGPGTRCASSRA